MLYFMAAALPAMLLINASNAEAAQESYPRRRYGRRYAGIGKNDEQRHGLPMRGNVGRFVQMRQNE